MADRQDQVIQIDLDDEAAAAAPAGDIPVLNEDAPADELPQGAALQADGSVLYALRFPRTLQYRRSSDGVVREDEIATLHFHRLTGADMRAVAAAKGDMMTVVAIAKSVRMNEARLKLIFDRLDGQDAAAAGEIVMSFLGTGRKTGR